MNDDKRGELVRSALRERHQTYKERIEEIVREDPVQLCRNKEELEAHRARDFYGKAFQEAYELAREKHKEGFYMSDENVAAVFATMFDEMLKRGFVFYG